MKLLNIGCGFSRPGEPFTNLDNLLEQHAEGSPERNQILSEPNYVEHNLLNGPLPFSDGDFEGAAILHCLEHFEAQAGVNMLRDCLRVLSPGGVLLVSVPDASYFRSVDASDKNENWPALFGQRDPKNPIPTFREAALFFDQHRMVFTENSLWCFLRQSGVSANNIARVDFNKLPPVSDPITALDALLSIVNRRIFSLVMTATK